MSILDKMFPEVVKATKKRELRFYDYGGSRYALADPVTKEILGTYYKYQLFALNKDSAEKKYNCTVLTKNVGDIPPIEDLRR